MKDLTGAAMHTVTAITRPRQAEVPRSRKPGRRARGSQKATVDPNGSATAEPYVSRLEDLPALAAISQ